MKRSNHEKYEKKEGVWKKELDELSELENYRIRKDREGKSKR